ncbi:peptidylprolyl isomerase fpr4 [Tulasnella sp. 427]|nr:peptidylprolyl isomerase fpr4 [Tulasnella sp. 427]
MAVCIAIWSQVLTPGGRVRVIPGADFRVTTATFAEDLADEKGRTTIKLYRLAMPEEDDEDEEDEEDDDDEEKELTFEKDPVVIGHLIPGKIESQQFDLVFSEEEPVEFEITGKNKVYLVGNYIDQTPVPLPDGEYDSEDDDDAYDLDEVSSDVAMDATDLLMGDDDDDDEEAIHAKIEEIKETSSKVEKKDKKRPRESNEGEAEAESSSKKDKKKKQKLESGAAGPAPVNGAAEKKEEKKETKKEEKKEKKKNIQTTKSGVTVDVRTEGKGPAAKNGQKLSMRYIGKLQNGHVFDKNVKGSPFTFTLGKGEVIKGWDEGLVGLNVGTEAVLTIPPSAAYGKRKMDDIPANSTLTFEVKVLSIK